MKRKLLCVIAALFLVLVLSGCGGESSETHTETTLIETRTFSLHWGDVERFIDEEAGVICWIYTSSTSTRGSIDCMPIQDTRIGDTSD
jgi:hypothetical protein